MSLATERRGAAPSASLWAKVGALAPLWTLILLTLFFGVASDSFFRAENLTNILGQVSTLAVISTGMTFVLLTAEIDLSVASTATLSGVFAAYFTAKVPLSPVLAIVIGIAVVTLLGTVNGLGTTRVGIPSFMMTLSMMVIASGMALYLTKGRVIFEIPPVLRTIGAAKVGVIPTTAIVAAVVLALGHFVLTYTRFGRYVYMVGANREAAELSGVNTRVIVTLCLTISGFTAGLAGMLNLGRMGSAHPAGMENMLIDAVAAVVLGGTSLFGGEGGILNTVLGLLIFGVLRSGLNQVTVDIYAKVGITGIILLAALVFNMVAGRFKERA